jgi:hypothetical protein
MMRNSGMNGRPDFVSALRPCHAEVRKRLTLSMEKAKSKFETRVVCWNKNFKWLNSGEGRKTLLVRNSILYIETPEFFFTILVYKTNSNWNDVFTRIPGCEFMDSNAILIEFD